MKQTANRREIDVVAEMIADLDDDAIFSSTANEACVALPLGSLSQTFSIADPRLADWLRDRYFRIQASPLGEAALRNVLATLRARAMCSSRRRIVDVRIIGRTSPDPAIHIDLCNSRGESVVITAQGWRITTVSEVAFRSTRGERALPLPESNAGAADSLPALLNIDTENWHKLQTWLLAALRPKGPYPVLIIQGPGGSGKSTAARIIRAILDPVAAPLHPLPSQEGQAMQLAYRNRILAFDHVTRMSNSVADALCRLSTGTCVTIRQPGHQPPIELDLARPILITANENFKPRPDLARRAITIELKPLTDPQPLDEVLAKLAQILPNLLATLYTRLASTLTNPTRGPNQQRFRT